MNTIHDTTQIVVETVAHGKSVEHLRAPAHLILGSLLGMRIEIVSATSIALLVIMRGGSSPLMLLMDDKAKPGTQLEVRIRLEVSQ